MKTPEQVKEYHKRYYEQHKDVMNQQHDTWRKANPERVKEILYRWLTKTPHYSRDYKRKRTAITDQLIFQFLDNGFRDKINDFISCLQRKGIPAQHIKYFKKDVKKYLPKEKN